MQCRVRLSKLDIHLSQNAGNGPSLLHQFRQQHLGLGGQRVRSVHIA